MAENATVPAESLQPFVPEAMMRRAELSEARRLLRNLDRIYEQSRLDDALPRLERRGYKFFTSLREPFLAEVDELAARVWKREVGLERYSVVRVQRDDVDCRLQILSFSFRDGAAWPGSWVWKFGGRALRNDGTLGVKATAVGFRLAAVQRRHLDGVWRELRWPREVDPDALAS